MKEQLQLLASADYEERRAAREKAISLFNTFSEALYQRPGRLIIDVAPGGGFRFAVNIERKDSQGVEQMKVFCYDLVSASYGRGRLSAQDFSFTTAPCLPMWTNARRRKRLSSLPVNQLLEASSIYAV